MTNAIRVKRSGRADPDQTKTYLHLPFDVPEDIVRIDIAYHYTDRVGSDPQLTDGNTIDIGIFDPRGVEFMSAGFRGWSGSARQSFYLALDDATPGYLPGPIPSGTWHILLGLYKLAPQGCVYEVEIKLTPGQASGNIPFPTLLPLSSVPQVVNTDGWYCGDIHCHSYHSDGDSDPVEIVRYAESLGLDFLAITDHNVRSQLAALNHIDTPLILIPGFEVTTFKGHWNIWGDAGWIDFRITEEAQMAAAITEAVARGYVVSCNHPRPYGPEWVYENVDSFDCIEVWNGPWTLLNDTALEFWESRLRDGRRFTAVGGSDNHFLHQEHIARLAHPTLWIYCPGIPSAASLLHALRAGHVTISESPAGPKVILRAGSAMMGDSTAPPDDGLLSSSIVVRGGADNTLELHTAQGCMLRYPIDTDDCELTVQVNVTSTPYIRAQLVDERKQPRLVRALTNPIYLH